MYRYGDEKMDFSEAVLIERCDYLQKIWIDISHRISHWQ